MEPYLKRPVHGSAIISILLVSWFFFFRIFFFISEPWQGKFGQNKPKHLHVYSIMKVGMARVTLTFLSTAYGSIVHITRWLQHFWTSLCLTQSPERKLAVLVFPGFTSKNNTPSLGGFNS